jgi:hypothetical protein
MEAQRKILKKHKKYARDLIKTPKIFNYKITRMGNIES